jgi:dolichyl-phosphate-mannose-protein mannosyltransferase
LLDNALLVMSRVILPDIFLIVFGLGAVSAYLAARSRSGKWRWVFLALSALLAGAAASVKWTGLSGLGVVLAAWFVDWVVAGRPVRQLLTEGALLVVIASAVYVASWGVHFGLLMHSGPGDPFMSTEFRMQLPGNSRYSPAAPRLSLIAKISDAHHAIRYGNGSLQNASHPYASPWYTWPVMKHPVGLWQQDSTQTATSPHTMLILLGNPVVWWSALIGAAIGLVGFFARRARFTGKEFGFFVLLFGLLLNYLPFVGITRLMYLYHYLFPLVYLIAFAVYAGGATLGWMKDDTAPWVWTSRGSAALYGGLILLMAIGFVYFAPFTFGWTLSAQAFDQRFWVLHPF